MGIFILENNNISCVPRAARASGEIDDLVLFCRAFNFRFTTSLEMTFISLFTFLLYYFANYIIFEWMRNEECHLYLHFGPKNKAIYSHIIKGRISNVYDRVGAHLRGDVSGSFWW